MNAQRARRDDEVGVQVSAADVVDEPGPDRPVLDRRLDEHVQRACSSDTMSRAWLKAAARLVEAPARGRAGRPSSGHRRTAWRSATTGPAAPRGKQLLHHRRTRLAPDGPCAAPRGPTPPCGLPGLAPVRTWPGRGSRRRRCGARPRSSRRRRGPGTRRSSTSTSCSGSARRSSWRRRRMNQFGPAASSFAPLEAGGSGARHLPDRASAGTRRRA